MTPGTDLVTLGALSVHPITADELLDVVFAALDQGQGGRIATVNVDFLQRAAEDADLARLYQACELRVADGIPVLWLARLGGRALPARVAGSDLVWSLSARARREGRSVFLLGGEQGVADQAAAVLVERYPGLSIAGVASPGVTAPPTDRDLDGLRATLRAGDPDLVLCAFGTPKQEQIAAGLACDFPGTWWLGCGASLSFITGHRRRAPAWMQRSGTEWLHRMLEEPTRLGERYLRRNLPFLARTAGRELADRFRRRRAAQTELV